MESIWISLNSVLDGPVLDGPVLDGPVLLLVLTSALWGVTNPLIRRYSQGVQQAGRGHSWLQRRLAELTFLALNPKYTLCFLVNQLGSVLYLYTLAITELSLASSAVTALTFVITLCAGLCLGEPVGNMKYTLTGMACVVAGVYLCMAEKTQPSR